MSKVKCAIKGCRHIGAESLTMQGNFGITIGFMLCREHYEHRDEYFEYVKEDGSTEKASLHS